MKQIFFILLLTALIRPLPGQNLPSRACKDLNGYNRYWSVLSDRENNPSYTQPGGTGITKFPQISTMASSYGWIHEDFLLLENHSETIAVWAMKDKKDTEPEQKLYKDPAFTHSTGIQLESFDLLYVRKKVTGAVLLARSTFLRPDPDNPEAHVAGWYPSSQVEFLSYSMNEISEIVNNGIPMQSDLIRNIRLMDITDPSVLSDVVFGRYMNYLEDKASTLSINMYGS